MSEPESISLLPVELQDNTDLAIVAPTLTDSERRRLIETRIGALAESTQLRYKAEVGRFVTWCKGRKVSALPAHPRTIELYSTTFIDADLSVSSLNIAMAAIRWYHEAMELASPFDNPGLKITIRGARKTLARPPTKKTALVIETLIKVLNAMDYELKQTDGIWLPVSLNPADTRDRAILLLGFSGALRRSEVCALRVMDITRHKQGVTLDLADTKTAKPGELQHVAIRFGRQPTTCPARLLDCWLALLEGQKGELITPDSPVFRRVDRWRNIGDDPLWGRNIARMIKLRVKAAGIDPGSYSGHSMRSGFATTASDLGYTLGEIVSVTRHKSREVAARYIQSREDFKNRATDLGL